MLAAVSGSLDPCFERETPPVLSLKPGGSTMLRFSLGFPIPKSFSSSSSSLSKWWMPSPLARGVGAVGEERFRSLSVVCSTKISLML